MRALPLLLGAAWLALPAGAAAQTQATPPGDSESVSSVQVSAPTKAPFNALRIFDEQAQQIKGAYALSNGWYLKVSTATRHIDATIDGDTRLRLFAVAPYRFVSADRNVTVEFNRGPEGEDMLMSYRPDRRLAQVVVVSTALAAR